MLNVTISSTWLPRVNLNNVNIFLTKIRLLHLNFIIFRYYGGSLTVGYHDSFVFIIVIVFLDKRLIKSTCMLTAYGSWLIDFMVDSNTR